jgi:hypothetical protein
MLPLELDMVEHWTQLDDEQQVVSDSPGHTAVVRPAIESSMRQDRSPRNRSGLRATPAHFIVSRVMCQPRTWTAIGGHSYASMRGTTEVLRTCRM